MTLWPPTAGEFLDARSGRLSLQPVITNAAVIRHQGLHRTQTTRELPSASKHRVKNFEGVPTKVSLTGSKAAEGQVVLCFSHLRWSFVYQRPQHLMTRLQRRLPVLFFEEPIFEEREVAELRAEVHDSGVKVLTPLLPHGVDPLKAQKSLLDQFLAERHIQRCLAWYYTPMALEFSRHLQPDITVYDCMDELSNFAGAPPKLLSLERELFAQTDVVFVGGRSLHEVKCQQHENTHLFPSSIDREHFSVARGEIADPEDQSAIPHPRIGFFGVLDERLDRELLASVADSHPEWEFVLIGPVVKIAPDSLPQAANLHYLGKKEYAELPRYLANWEIAMLPFAMNASTRFISPTKTPEYLAAGRPVVSTPIPDVVEPYGRLGLARIAANAEEFAGAIGELLDQRDEQWLERVDGFMRNLSWDRTFAGMWQEIESLSKQKAAAVSPGECQKEEEARV